MLYPLSYERFANQMFYPVDLTSGYPVKLTCGLAADATVLGCAASVQEHLIRGLGDRLDIRRSFSARSSLARVHGPRATPSLLPCWSGSCGLFQVRRPTAAGPTRRPSRSRSIPGSNQFSSRDPPDVCEDPTCPSGVATAVGSDVKVLPAIGNQPPQVPVPQMSSTTVNASQSLCTALLGQPAEQSSCLRRRQRLTRTGARGVPMSPRQEGEPACRQVEPARE
jgi:hypothetical protein